MNLFAAHVHTRYSYDCLTSPEDIVRLAARNGIRGVLVCDHGTCEGSRAARYYAQQKGLGVDIPIAAEYATDVGDIIVANIPDGFTALKNHRDLCRAAKQAGGTVILPHPGKGHLLDKVDFLNIDAIEVFNSRCSVMQNRQALALALREEKPMIYGCDAHRLAEMLNVVMAYEGDDPFAARLWPLRLTPTTAGQIAASQLVKGFKTRSPWLCCDSALILAKNAVRGIFRREPL